jgi:RimJ/RimL family protein N-acetyltransferase
MQTGQILHKFTARDGQHIIIRTLKWEDLDDLVHLINSLVDERADILLGEPVTRDSETDWLSRRLAAVEKGNTIQIVAEVKNHVIATAELSIKSGFQSHVRELGIIMLKDYRDLGIGTEMLEELISQAQERGVKMITLGVNSTNLRAQHVYNKLGFRECGRIPSEIYKDGQYIDHIIMVKILDETIVSR